MDGWMHIDITGIDTANLCMYRHLRDETTLCASGILSLSLCLSLSRVVSRFGQKTSLQHMHSCKHPLSIWCLGTVLTWHIQCWTIGSEGAAPRACAHGLEVWSLKVAVEKKARGNMLVGHSTS